MPLLSWNLIQRVIADCVQQWMTSGVFDTFKMQFVDVALGEW